MDAIAHGLEAKIDSFSAFSEVVTQKTIDIARQLDIAEEEIHKWATVKAKLVAERDRIIKSEPSKYNWTA
jgi:hypothetical protein